MNQSEEEAVKYYRKAAELGDTIAKDILKAMGYPLHADQFEKSLLQTSEFIPKDMTKSFQYSTSDKKPLLSSVYVSNYLKKNPVPAH